MSEAMRELNNLLAAIGLLRYRLARALRSAAGCARRARLPDTRSLAQAIQHTGRSTSDSAMATLLERRLIATIRVYLFVTTRAFLEFAELRE